MGVAGRFQGRTFRVARHCVPERMGSKDLGKVKCNSATGRSYESPTLPPWACGSSGGGDAVEGTRKGGRGVSESAPVGSVRRGNGATLGLPPSLSAQTPPASPRLVPVTSSPSRSVQLSPLASPFDKNCVGKVAPMATLENFGNSAYDELRRPCS